MSRLRVCVVLPGLHRVSRGAEVAFESIARHLAHVPGFEVTLIGTGQPRTGEPYRFLHAGCIARTRFERWPRIPVLRSDCVYEELTFAAATWGVYRPEDYDVTMACSYPFVNWLLRARGRRTRPAHVYVTQNGDWPCHAGHREYRLFGCDGLVCTNPEYYERNRTRWNCKLIPNGVDPELFCPGPAQRGAFGLPERGPVVLMVSALIPSKRVCEGIAAAAALPDVHLVVAGDGPQRELVESFGRERMGGRFRRVSVGRERMPALYRCADVFLHMSQIEPSSNAYIEALASGLPIVTHDRAVTRWTFEDQALLVDTNDAAAVGAALVAALNQPRERNGQARRELVRRRFTWSAIANEYAVFLSAVCNGRIPRGADVASLGRRGA